MQLDTSLVASPWRDRLLVDASGSTRPDQFLVGLTGVRALAALMVMSFHLFGLAVPRLLAFNIADWQITYHWLITCSWMGANVFFVLSGFLVAIPFVRNIEGAAVPVQIIPYLVRRIRRVVPAYWFQIVALCVVLHFTASLPGWQAIAMHFAFLQNFNQGYASALNGVYWTLPTEFGYYLLLPLFAAIALQFRFQMSAAWRVLSVLLIAFAIGYRVLAYDAISEEGVGKKFFTLLQLPGLIDHFAIGMLLAGVYVRYASRISSRWADGMMLAGLLGIMAMMASLDNVYLRYWNGHFLLFVGYTITACFIGLLVLGVAVAGSQSMSRALFANTPMLYLGVISYSLYLWHVPMQQWTMKLLDYFLITGDRLGWLVAISVPLSILAATISYYLIERPFLSHRPPRRT